MLPLILLLAQIFPEPNSPYPHSGGSGPVELASFTTQTTGASGTAGTSTTFNGTGATAIFADFVCFGSSCPETIISSTGDTYTREQCTAASGLCSYAKFSPTVSSSMTLGWTCSSVACYGSISGHVYSGTFTGVHDKFNNNTATGTSVTTGTTGTLSQSVEVCESGVYLLTSSAPSIANSFTGLVSTAYLSGTTLAGAGAYLITSSTAAQNPTWSFTTSNTVYAIVDCYY